MVPRGVTALTNAQKAAGRERSREVERGRERGMRCTLQTSRSSRDAAQCSAAMPMESCALTSAPALSSMSTMPGHAMSAAMNAAAVEQR